MCSKGIHIGPKLNDFNKNDTIELKKSWSILGELDRLHPTSKEDMKFSSVEDKLEHIMTKLDSLEQNQINYKEQLPFRRQTFGIIPEGKYNSKEMNEARDEFKLSKIRMNLASEPSEV